MRSLIRSAVVTMSPSSVWGQRILSERAAIKEAAEMNLAADTIEQMLCKGLYSDNMFMCIALRWAGWNKDIPEEGVKAAVAAITAQLGKNRTLHGYLRQIGKPTVELYGNIDSFTTRIAHSNWFWGFIRQLRQQAEHRAHYQW